MDYFGSGKVIVATYTDEYKDKSELLAMSEKNEDYPMLFSEVISNLDKWNCQAKQEERKQFAYQNMYVHKINNIEQIIIKLHDKAIAKKLT
jgi:hypothetical protein